MKMHKDTKKEKKKFDKILSNIVAVNDNIFVCHKEKKNVILTTIYDYNNNSFYAIDYHSTPSCVNHINQIKRDMKLIINAISYAANDNILAI